MWDLEGLYVTVCTAEIVACGWRILKALLGNSIRLGGGMDGICLAQNEDGSQGLVDMEMIFDVP